VLVGVFLAVTVELVGASSLAFAVGAYLPLATTLPIFCGGLVRWIAERGKKPATEEAKHGDEDELGPGNLFSTGLVAGGALAGVLYAILAARMEDTLAAVKVHEPLVGALGAVGYDLLGVACFVLMGAVLYRVATRTSGS
jgi:uncharacterized oligopeptide transporter (OPT) family protein